jgi:hypothetical protein
MHPGQPRPITEARLSDAVRRAIDAAPSTESQAFRLSTVDAAGWPHGAQLGPGELLCAGDDRIVLALWPGSRTTANLRRDGRALLTVIADGAVHELRLMAFAASPPIADPTLAWFDARIEACEAHRAAYATVLGGVTYRLNDPAEALPRLERQRDGLRALGARPDTTPTGTT